MLIDKVSFKRVAIKLHLMQAGIVSLSVGVFLALIVPLQTLLGNRAMFSFGAGDVVIEALPLMLIVIVATFALFVLSELLFGGWGGVISRALVVSLLMCSYLEVGLFSIGLPPLDGEMRAFANPFRVLIDSGLLMITFVALLVLLCCAKTVSHWIALVVLIMGVASLFDVKKSDAVMENSLLKNGFCPQIDIVKSARFSKERNVIVLVLDSTPAVIASKTFRDDLELQGRFPGFVMYEKNLAMSEITTRGLPGLMTGKYLQKDMSASEYISSVFGQNSFIVPYAESDMPVFFSDQMLTYGYTNRRLGDFSKIGDGLKTDGPVFFRNSTDIPYITFFDLVKFRLVPYKYKSKVLISAYLQATKSLARTDVFRESVLYPILQTAPLSNEKGTTLSVFHTWGIHGPISMDRDGNQLPLPTQDVQAYYEYGVYVFKQVAKFFDSLMALGVYDNSFIIVCADHGVIYLREGDGTKGHGAESSVLMVKRPKDRAPLSFSTLPTSNAKLCELVKALRTRDLERSEIDAILEMHNRKFIAKFGSTFFSFGRSIHFYEWMYDDDNKVTSCECLGIFKAN